MQGFSRAATGLALLLLVTACRSDSPTGVESPPPTPTVTVPSINREFRGLWIATVANIDWPSQSGLSVSAQQTELAAILDMARNTGLNAIVLQVRAAGDALYPSSLEPWARSLTGTQGVDPGWDPLSYAVSEAHARGLELHAWFNPFRAGNLSDTSRLAPLHFARRRPDLARAYCGQLWFDPAEDAVHDQAIAVIRDVLQRYDVDAVHMDDFFYPYPDSRCPNLDFPDSAGYARYVASGGTAVRGDWRRANVNRFVQRLYAEVHAVRAQARVGISPFGIWRPGNPAGITGLDAYASIYADSRLWLQQGWVDYLAPQLYWSIASTGQSFPALLDWWLQQNTRQRHLWPGLAAYRVADGTSSAYSASEITSQITQARQRNATGTLLYNTSVLRENRAGLTTTLATTTYATGALPPATPWLDGSAPATPSIDVTGPSGAPGALRVAITAGSSKPLSWWLIRWRNGTTWSQRVAPASNFTYDVPGTAGGVATSAVVVNAIDRVGNASGDAVWHR